MFFEVYPPQAIHRLRKWFFIFLLTMCLNRPFWEKSVIWQKICGGSIIYNQFVLDTFLNNKNKFREKWFTSILLTHFWDCWNSQFETSRSFKIVTLVPTIPLINRHTRLSTTYDWHKRWRKIKYLVYRLRTFLITHLKTGLRYKTKKEILRQYCLHQKNYNGNIEIFRDIPCSTKNIEAPSNTHKSLRKIKTKFATTEAKEKIPTHFGESVEINYPATQLKPCLEMWVTFLDLLNQLSSKVCSKAKSNWGTYLSRSLTLNHLIRQSYLLRPMFGFAQYKTQKEATAHPHCHNQKLDIPKMASW